MAQRGITPAQADEMELWEAAAAMGLAAAEQAPEGEVDLIAERMKAAREGRTLTAEDLPRSQLHPMLGSLGAIARGPRAAQ